MFWKFWFPLLLIAGVYFLGKLHARRKQHIGQETLTPLNPTPVPLQRVQRNASRTTALTLLLIMITTVSWYIYHNWNETHAVVEVRVIHVQTQHTTVYQAQRHKVQGRSFYTMDGRLITLADVERMEIHTLPAP